MGAAGQPKKGCGLVWFGVVPGRVLQPEGPGDKAIPSFRPPVAPLSPPLSPRRSHEQDPGPPGRT